MEMKRFGKSVFVLVVVLTTAVVFAGTVSAADYKYGVRVRGLAVLPDAEADNELSSLGIDASDDLTPELDLEFFYLELKRGT